VFGSNLLQKGAPSIDNPKYIGMDEHKEAIVRWIRTELVLKAGKAQASVREVRSFLFEYLCVLRLRLLQVRLAALNAGRPTRCNKF
jgi:hypothetical protein